MMAEEGGYGRAVRDAVAMTRRVDESRSTRDDDGVDDVLE